MIHKLLLTTLQSYQKKNKMTKSYSILQSKLEQLESKLNQALHLPPDTKSHIAFAEDITHKFTFVRKLLSAEAASHPSKPRHLYHIAEKLARLERAFCDWFRGRAKSLYDQNDNESSCSCTESCMNDDGDAGCNVSEDPEMVSQELESGEKALVQFEEVDAEKFAEVFDENKAMVEFEGENEGKMAAGNFGFQWNEIGSGERKNGVFGFRKLCLAMSGGAVVGMILMGYLMIKFSGCFHYVDQASHLTPT